MEFLEEESGPPVRIGCDMGQVTDPSTIALAEITSVDRGRKKTVWRQRALYTITGKRTIDEEVEVPYLESSYRFPLIEQIALGTRYREVARRISDIACSKMLLGRNVAIYVDQTGVGRPITESLQDELASRKRGQEITVYPITFITGDDYNEERGKMGKGYLAARLSLLMEQHLLHFTKGSPWAEALRSQLATFNRRMNERGYAQYGAFGSGQHDDLVIACGLCTLEDQDQGMDDAEIVRALRMYRGY
jgi:hypothetical protein